MLLWLVRLFNCMSYVLLVRATVQESTLLRLFPKTLVHALIYSIGYSLCPPAYGILHIARLELLSHNALPHFLGSSGYTPACPSRLKRFPPWSGASARAMRFAGCKIAAVRCGPTAAGQAIRETLSNGAPIVQHFDTSDTILVVSKCQGCHRMCQKTAA
jgi:hypothetical protein